MKPIVMSPLRKTYYNFKKPLNCPFCDLESNHVIKKGDKMAVILNNFPYTSGHLLIIPLVHKELYEELDEEELKESLEMIKLSLEALKKTYNPSGFNLGINWGSGSGGSVKHLHIHVVPRFNNDANFLHTTNDTSLIVEPLPEIKNKLLKFFTKQV